MGEGPIAVADAGPLIHLFEVGSLQLLAIFPAIHIPGAVWAETVMAGRVDERLLTAASAVQRHTVQAQALDELARTAQLHDLHAGELECLALCMHEHIPLLLTDDLAAREAARRLGVQPVGSLGVIVRAFHTGRLSLIDAERILAELHSVSTLFVTPALIDMAIEQLRSRR